MPAWLISALKWIATTILVPVIQKWVEQWQKSKERASRLKRVVKKNQEKTEEYEKNPSDDNFSSLP